MLSGTGDHYTAHIMVFAGFELFLHQQRHLPVKGIVFLRPVERDKSYVVLDIK